MKIIALIFCFLVLPIIEAQTIAPVQIKPGTNNQVMTTIGGKTAWGNPAAGGVTTFNLRTGAVVPAAGDYNCSQITSAICSLPSLFYQTVQVDGATQTQRSKLNLVNGSAGTVSCVDNPVSGSTDCTFTGGTSSGITYSITDVTGARFVNTPYQNTTSAPMFIQGSVSTSGSGTGNILVAQGLTSGFLPWVGPANQATATVANGDAGFSATIMPGYWYIVQTTGVINRGVHHWTEITSSGSGGGGGGGVTPTGTGFPKIIAGVQQAAAAAVDLSSADAIGVLAAARVPAFTGDVANIAGSLAFSITAGAVTNAKLTNPSTTVNGQLCTLGGTCTIITGSTPSGTGVPKIIGGVQQAAASAVDLSSADATGVLAAARVPAYTGDVTSSAGGLVNTITAGAVTNAKLANPATTVNGQSCVLGGACTIPAGGGTVTNFAAPPASFPSWFVPSVLNPTTTPTLSVTAATQAASTFLRGPNSGAAAAPSFGPILSSEVTGALGFIPYQTPTLTGNLNIGVLADYSFSQGAGTVLVDGSGAGNNGTLGTGANAPTWLGNAMQFTQGFDQNVSLPVALNAGKTFTIAFYWSPVSTVPGASVPLYNSTVYSPILSSSLGSAGINFIFNAPGGNAPEDFGEPAIWNSSLSSQSLNFTTGFHVYTYVLGTGAGNLDKIYIDGTEVPYSVQGSSAGAQTSGNLFFGSSGVGPWATQGGQFVAYRMRVLSTQLGAADVQQLTQIMRSDVATRGVPTSPFPLSIGTPMLHCVGDSLTAGLNQTTPYCSLLTLTNQPAYTIKNWGIGGINLQTLTASEPNRVALQCQPTTGGPAPVILWGGTNDIGASATVPQVWAALGGEVAVLKKAGCTVFVSTIIDRMNPDIHVQKNAINALIRTGAKAIGADGIVDMAAAPQLGADGASNSTTYFGSGGLVHPNDAGQVYELQAANAALNYYYGANAAAPTILTSTPYTMATGDGYLNIKPTANTIITLPSCIGQSGAIYRVNVQQATGFTLTVKNAATTEPINGTDYSSTGLTAFSGAGTIFFTDVPNPSAAAGCHWDALAQSSTGSGTVTNVTGATSGGFVVSTTAPTSAPIVSVAADVSHYMPLVTDQTAWNGKQAAFITQGANTVWGNCTGASAIPSACAMTVAMVPTLNQNTTGNSATSTLAANSTALGGIAVTGTPSVGMVPTATSASAATWQTPPGGAATSIQVNGTVTTTATPVNLKTGLGNGGVIPSNPSAGNVEFNLSLPQAAGGTNFTTGPGTGIFANDAACFNNTTGSIKACSAGNGLPGIIAGANIWTQPNTFNKPIVAGGSTPTMVAGAAAGTAPTCTTLTGFAGAGVITCTTGTATTTGTLSTITTPTAATAAQGCQLTPRNAAAALANTSIYTTAPTTTTWTITIGSALTASTAYSWSYICE